MSLVNKGTLQGLGSPQPRIYALSDTFENGSPKNLFEGKPLEIAGSCILYDPTDAIIGTLEIALDSRTRSGVEFFTLAPGVILDFRSGQYNNVYFRFTPAYFNINASRCFLGRVIFAPSMQGDTTGATPAAPQYQRSVPKIAEPFNARQGVTGTHNWAANAGGTGIFALTLIINAFSAVGTGTASGVKAYLYNDGSESIYATTSLTALTNPASAIEFSQVFEIEPGNELEIENIFIPNNPRQVAPVTNPLIGAVVPIRLYGATAPQVRGVVTTYF